jgi:hypothetical protein
MTADRVFLALAMVDYPIITLFAAGALTCACMAATQK